MSYRCNASSFELTSTYFRENMASQDYHFITHWKVTSDCMQVYKIIDNPIDLTRWWPNVYLEAREIEPGDENGIGRVVSLLTKRWLAVVSTLLLH